MMQLCSDDITTKRRSRDRLLIPAAAAGLMLALGVLWLVQPAPAVSVSEVEREIRRVALHRSDRSGVEPGGPIGLWWITASEVDEISGEFRDFRLRSGSIRLAAREALLRIDPDRNTIRFELRGVVFTKLPDRPNDDSIAHSLIEMETYILGPVPYAQRIVRDSDAGRRQSRLEKLVGVDPSP